MKEKIMNNDRELYGRRTAATGVILNLILATIKIIAGVVSGMVSIVADGVNNLSDAAASIATLAGFKLSLKSADDEHPFGHGRYEYIAGLVVSFIVMMAGVELLKTSVTRLFNPAKIDVSTVTIATLIVSIITKAGMFFMYKSVSTKIKSQTLYAAACDSRNDVVATISVFAGSAVYIIWNINIDGILGIFVALFVIYGGIGLTKDTIKPLLGTTPEKELTEAIEKKVLSYEGVLGTHDLMVHDYGPGRTFASVHVEVPAERNVLECHEIIDQIEQDVKNEMGIQLVIHYDPIVTSDEEVGSMRNYLKQCARDIYEKLTIHDLRIVPGEKNTNVIFDCVVPSSCPVKEKEVIEELSKKLREKFPDHTAVIKIDHSYVSLD